MDTVWNRDWYTDQGIKLPRQVGGGINYIYMNRGIEITDVSVTLGNRPPQSISDTVDFELENKTTLTMIRADIWALPFLDLYLLAGETRTDAALSAIINVEDPNNPGTTEPIRIDTNDQMKGPLMGLGATVVYGGDAWFAMCDANYSRTEMDAFDSYIDALYASARLGCHTTQGRFSYRAWGGVDCKLKCPVWKLSAPCQNEPFFNSPQTRIGASAWSKRKVTPHHARAST